MNQNSQSLPKFDWQILVTPGHTIAARARRLSFFLAILTPIAIATFVFAAKPEQMLTAPADQIHYTTPAWTARLIVDRDHMYQLGHVGAMYPLEFAWLDAAAAAPIDHFAWIRSSKYAHYIAKILPAIPVDNRMKIADFSKMMNVFAGQYVENKMDVAKWKIPDDMTTKPVVTSFTKFSDNLDNLKRGVIAISDKQAFIVASTDRGLEAVIVQGNSCKSLFDYISPCSSPQIKGKELDALKPSVIKAKK